MRADVVAHHALLVLAASALAAAGLRLAGRLDVGGGALERALAAFTFAAAAAVCCALGLGLLGRGGDSFALGAAAIAIWVIVGRLVRPATPEVWGPIGPTLGAVGGVAVGWIVFQLRHPFIGGDGLIYHLPIASAWVQNGRPGSLVGVLDGLPVANYPVTNEVLVGWGLAISRSWVTASIWSPVLWLALAGGGWLALGELAVAPRERALAVAAVCVLPLTVFGLGGPTTDIATTAWLAVAAGLALAARRSPGLVYPAILAAALCLGTKTTPALLILALGLAARRRLAATARGQPWPLAATVAFGVVVGGIWPLRDLLDHGSPLWPFVAAPWGDPVPAALAPLRDSFLEHTRQLVGANYNGYLDVVAGGLVLMAAGVGLAALRRSPAALAAGGAAAAALLAWAAAPYTGIRTDDFAVGATRYLLPALAACALATAVASRGAGRRLRGAVTLALAASIAWSCWRTVALGFPYVPSPGLFAVAALAGAALRVRRDRRLTAVVLVIASAVGLSVAADGYARRHAATGLPDGPLLRAAVPALAEGSRTISSAPGTVVMLRGDRLERSLALIPGDATCAAVRRRLWAGVVVLESDPPSPLYQRLSGCLAGVARAQPYATYVLFE